MGKVFISYSHKDESFAEELYRRLSRDGVDCFFDKESISWGANWVVSLEKGLDESEFILLVLSKDFCQSEWSKLERTSILAEDPVGLKKRLRPLLLENCRDILPLFLKPINYIDVSTTDKFNKAYPKICKNLGGICNEENCYEDRTELPPKRELLDHHLMPYRPLGNGFVDRVRELWMAIISVASALIFIILLLVIAIFIPKPAPFQLFIFRVILALAAAAFGATIPGFIKIDVPLWGKGLIRAGGALALFVLVYTVNPPILIHEEGTSIPPVMKKEKQQLCGTVWNKKGEHSEPIPGVIISIPEYRLKTNTNTQGGFCLEVYAEKEISVRLMAQKYTYKTCFQDTTLGNTNLDIVMEVEHAPKP